MRYNAILTELDEIQRKLTALQSPVHYSAATAPPPQTAWEWKALAGFIAFMYVWVYYLFIQHTRHQTDIEVWNTAEARVHNVQMEPKVQAVLEKFCRQMAETEAEEKARQEQDL